jgi:hypothetical protein
MRRSIKRERAAHKGGIPLPMRNGAPSGQLSAARAWTLVAGLPMRVAIGADR